MVRKTGRSLGQREGEGYNDGEEIRSHRTTVYRDYMMKEKFGFGRKGWKLLGF